MTEGQLSYMGRGTYSYSLKKSIQRTCILPLSNSKTLRKVTHLLMTSLKINDVTKLGSWDAIGNVTLTAQGAQQDFILPGEWK